MFSWFSKNPKESIYSILQADMHSHLIPGIDDGSPDMQTSLSFIRTLVEMGYQKLIVTPHVFADLYPNDSKIIKKVAASLQHEVRRENLNVTIEAAAEYFVDKHFEKLLGENDILCFGEARYVLIEMSFVSASANLEDVIFHLVAQGYKPVLAHPERYTYLINNKSFFKRIQSLGCLLQINILSLLGYYGKTVQQWAVYLLSNNFMGFVGTDLHHEQHLKVLSGNRFSRKLHTLFSAPGILNHKLTGNCER
jgi:protein-tyrosine phosphatase